MTLRLAFTALLLASAAAPAALAQAVVQPLPGTTDADRLAAQMRIIGGDPTNLEALLTAGELSVKLDDLGAAASFFARAERIDPRNGRAKAGQGAILVHAERPGEALRYFAQAEAAGLAPAAFASDRGLAYDLIGEGERAQRDYRLALRTTPDDEARRRYALSLGIAGKRDLAEEQLEPLLRGSDRGAWRAHAFILAMSGDQAGATRIATTMMPPGTAAGLQPFFQQLPALGPVDRAFAVHFGEVRTTPQRIADARLTPPLPVLGPDPYAPRVAVAAAPPPGKRKEKDRNRGKRAPVQVAAAAPTPPPLPEAPGYRSGAAPAAAPPMVARGTASASWPTPVTPVSRSSVPAAVARAPVASAPPGTSSPPPMRGAPPAETNVIVAAVPPNVASARATPAPVAPPLAVATVSSPTVVAASTSSPTQPASPTPTPAVTAGGAAPTAWPTAITPQTPHPVPPPSPVIAARPASASGLSGIVASLPIPASELGVEGPRRPAPVEATAAAPVVDQAALDRATAAKALADKRAADRKAAADKKALAEKKAAAEKKAEEAREAAAQKKLERANPERLWVQVAGGANEHDLAKAWAAAKAKGGDVFAGHATGWTTPLRFTNRVLAGPFKTADEARAFVNKAKAAGLSAFTFTSDAGQVVRKLGAE